MVKHAARTVKWEMGPECKYEVQSQLTMLILLIFFAYFIWSILPLCVCLSTWLSACVCIAMVLMYVLCAQMSIRMFYLEHFTVVHASKFKQITQDEVEETGMRRGRGGWGEGGGQLKQNANANTVRTCKRNDYSISCAMRNMCASSMWCDTRVLLRDSTVSQTQNVQLRAWCLALWQPIEFIIIANFFFRSFVCCTASRRLCVCLCVFVCVNRLNYEIAN